MSHSGPAADSNKTGFSIAQPSSLATTAGCVHRVEPLFSREIRIATPDRPSHCPEYQAHSRSPFRRLKRLDECELGKTIGKYAAFSPGTDVARILPSDKVSICELNALAIVNAKAANTEISSRDAAACFALTVRFRRG